MFDDEFQVETSVEKAIRAERISRSESARVRRQETKLMIEAHDFKEQKEARERMKAKRQMEKLHKQRLKKATKN